MKLFYMVIFVFIIISLSLSQKLGRHTPEEWQTIIDTTWGEGLPTANKLAIFDYVYNIIDREFACFQGLPENIMDSLSTIYRPEIEAGVSRGRFAAIMNYFMLSFKEGHNWIADKQVSFNNNTPLVSGIPLFVVAAWSDNSHFGATLTPLPDSSLLVIRTLPDHPLGLVPGDIVLGYDGIPWKVLYKQILQAQFPFFLAFALPSYEKSITHVMLKDAGMNWHLFDTLDVVKYSNGDTLHFPTSELAGQSGNIAGNEQIKIPGVPFPAINWQGVFNFDVYNQKNYVSWGIIDNTDIGYIYVYAWATPDQAPGSDISGEFYRAVDSLMNYHRVEGLIIDSRLDFGFGQFDTDDKGLSLLFNDYIETFAIDRRCNATDHYYMCPDLTYTPARIAIPGESTTFFDRPIAVLTGPGGFSMGDYFPQKVRFHPMARIFGKPSAGAFVGANTIFPFTDWTMIYAFGNGYLVGDRGNYLCRIESYVDEEIWLTQDDVAKGEDTVVKRAIEWAQNLSYAHDVKVDKLYAVPGIDDVTITAIVQNPNEHELSVKAVVRSVDLAVTDSLPLFDDGSHGDDMADDNVWSTTYASVVEQSYKISVTTSDLDDETSRTLPSVSWFTTIGPVRLYDSQYPYIDVSYSQHNRRQRINLILYNAGSVATAKNVRTVLSVSDSRISSHSSSINFGDIPAGSADTSGFYLYYTPDYGPDSTINDPIRINLTIYSDNLPYWIEEIDYITNLETNEGYPIPLYFSLSQNYPNPFNPSTNIEFTLPRSEFVELTVYNILGEEVSTLISKKLNAGNHTYTFDGKNLASGFYYYRLEAGNFVQTRKMLYLK